jgi:hypothetical protein
VQVYGCLPIWGQNGFKITLIYKYFEIEEFFQFDIWLSSWSCNSVLNKKCIAKMAICIRRLSRHLGVWKWCFLNAAARLIRKSSILANLRSK